MSRWTDTRNCEEIELEFWTQSSHFGVQPQLSSITIIAITIAFYNHHPPITTIIINLYWRWCTRRQRRRRVGCKYQPDFFLLFFYIFYIIVKRGRGVGSKYQPDFGCLMWMWMRHIPHICHRRHGRRPCKFFLAKNRRFFTDLTRFSV